jgi:hypothetical protein
MSETPATVSWIAATSEALRLAKNSSEIERQLADLGEASEALGPIVAAFEELRGGVAVLRPLDWAGASPSPELQASLGEAARNLNSRSLNRLPRLLTAFEASAKKALVESWARYASERLGSPDELLTLAATLIQVNSLQDSSRRLQEKLLHLARTQNEIPSAGAVQLLQEAKQILQQLEDSLQPDSVRRFLSAIARGGAPLEYLTPEVSDWLSAHSAGGEFRIVAGAVETATGDD